MITPTLPQGTRSRAGAAFGRLFAVENPPDVIFANPVLLRTDVLAAIIPPDDHEQLQFAEEIRRFAQQLEDRPSSFRLGTGPVEQVWGQVEQGGLSVDAAVKAVRSLQVTEHLVPSYVLALFNELEPLGASLETWRRTREQGRILLSAIEACDRRDEPALRDAAVLGRIRWTHGLLISVPDRALAEAAEESAGGLLERCRDDPPALATVQFALAAMWSDPYVANRVTGTAAQQDQEWRRRGAAENGTRDGRPFAEWEMPQPADGIRKGLTHWRAARDASPDDPTILIGLAEAGMYLHDYTGAEIEPDAIDAVRRGLELSAGVPALRTRFLGLASVLDLPGTGDELLPLELDPDTLVTRLGNDAGATAARAFEVSFRSAPERALEIAARHVELLCDPDQLDDAFFRTVAQHVAVVLNRVHGSPEASTAPPPDADYAEWASAVLGSLAAHPPATEDNERQQPSSLAVAATSMELARRSGSSNAELIGLELLRAARHTAPYFATRYDWVIRVLEADLLLGEGVNRYQGDDRIGAIRWYLRALDRWIEIGREQPVVQIMGRLTSIAEAAAGDNDAVAELVGLLADLTPRLVELAGSEPAQLLAELHRRLLGGMVESGGANSELVWACLQYAKGFRSAIAMQRPDAPRSERDPVLVDLLARLSNPAVSAAGARALRERFERERRRLLMSGARAPSSIDQRDAVDVLDDRTVLISTWSLRYSNQDLGRMAYVVASDDAVLLASPPEPDPAELPPVPAGLAPLLAEYAERGHDHLCLIPDELVLSSDLFRLADPAGGDAADRWVVTLLPHPDLLWEGRGGPRVRSRAVVPMVSVGVDNAPGLPALPNAEAEAEAVADLYAGADPAAVLLPGPAAGADDFLRVAPRSRRLHVATHGGVDRDAPSFQWLAFADRRLHAWEIAELDLRLVDLVTLSACDSAELVVSDGENLDGLAMAFLCAGARTVVGANQPIRSDASELFFTSFHRAVVDPAADLRDAFRDAQQAVREQFGDPAVWGAFYLLGDWW